MKKSIIMFIVVTLVASLILSPVYAVTTGMDTGQNVEEGIETSDESEVESDTTQSLDENEQTDEKVVFEDLNLELAIREKIGKISGDILPSDVEGITSLDASNKDISSLEGIQYLTNLKSLDLRGNYRIKNVEPLSQPYKPS